MIEVVELVWHGREMRERILESEGDGGSGRTVEEEGRGGRNVG